MDCSKNGRWTSPVKKFRRVRVKIMSHKKDFNKGVHTIVCGLNYLFVIQIKVWFMSIFSFIASPQLPQTVECSTVNRVSRPAHPCSLSPTSILCQLTNFQVLILISLKFRINELQTKFVRDLLNTRSVCTQNSLRFYNLYCNWYECIWYYNSLSSKI